MLGIRVICGILCFIIGYMISIFLDKRHTKKKKLKKNCYEQKKKRKKLNLKKDVWTAFKIKRRKNIMKEEKPVVDNSDIMMVDINELFGDAFTMVKVDNTEGVNILHNNDKEDE